MMRVRRAIAALMVLVPSIVLLTPSLTGGANDKTLLIELESRGSPLPAAVSNSGTTIVGNFNAGGGFYWMPTTGVIFNGGLFATDVSGDGRTIVGLAPDVRGVRNAAIWQRATEWRLLGGFGPPCDTSLSNAAGTSRDGKVVVGWARNGCEAAHAFRWEESTGLVDLGSSVAGQAQRGPRGIRRRQGGCRRTGRRGLLLEGRPMGGRPAGSVSG